MGEGKKGGGMRWRRGFACGTRASVSGMAPVLDTAPPFNQQLCDAITCCL